MDRSRLFLRGSFFFDQVIHYLNCTFSSADHVRGSDVLSVDGVGGRTVDFIGLPSFESAVIFDFGRERVGFGPKEVRLLFLFSAASLDDGIRRPR